MGNLKDFLGINFINTDKGILINQKQYIIQILIQHSMLNCNGTYTPMNKGKYIMSQTKLLWDTTIYERILGKLNYLAIYSMPDIVFTVSYLYRY